MPCSDLALAQRPVPSARGCNPDGHPPRIWAAAVNFRHHVRAHRSCPRFAAPSGMALRRPAWGFAALIVRQAAAEDPSGVGAWERAHAASGQGADKEADDRAAVGRHCHELAKPRGRVKREAAQHV